jgi:polar amino acid transport system substrate-binding protein
MKEVSMKRLAVLFAFLFATAIGVNSTVLAGALDEIVKRGTLRVGTNPGYMPFELTNQRGEIVGFDIDMANSMAKSMGVELELVPIAWDGIIAGLLTDKFDIIISGMTLTQERNLRINFAQPYIVIGQS